MGPISSLTVQIRNWSTEPPRCWAVKPRWEFSISDIRDTSPCSNVLCCGGRGLHVKSCPLGLTAKVATIIHSSQVLAVCNWLCISSQEAVESPPHHVSLDWPIEHDGRDGCFSPNSRTQGALLLFIFLGCWYHCVNKPAIACWIMITWNTIESMGQSQLRPQRSERLYSRSGKPARWPQRMADQEVQLKS